MPTITAQDHIQTTLWGGEKFVPGIEPASEVSVGKFTVIGGDGVIFVSNDSDAATPVKLVKDFSLSDSALNPQQGLFQDRKPAVGYAGLNGNQWSRFFWFVGTQQNVVMADDLTTFGLPYLSGGPNTVFDASVGNPTGNFYTTWYQEATFVKDWYDNYNDVFNNNPIERTVKFWRYKQIASTEPWAITESRVLQDSLSLLSLADLNDASPADENNEPYQYLGEDAISKVYFVTGENVDFDLSDYVSRPSGIEWIQWPRGPGEDKDGIMTVLGDPTFDAVNNGHILRYFRNGNGVWEDDTPMGFDWFDAAAANALTHLDPTDPRKDTDGEEIKYYDPYSGPDGGWSNAYEAYRRVGYLTYYREPYIREPYEGVFIGQSEFSYDAHTNSVLNDAWEGLINSTAFSATIESSSSVDALPIGSNKHSDGDYKDEWGYFDPSQSADFSNVPWAKLSIVEGQEVVFDPAWSAEVKFQLETGERIRVQTSIYRKWPIERDEFVGFDTEEYIFDSYESETASELFTETTLGETIIKEIDCRTVGRHFVCFEGRGVVAPYVVQGKFSVTIESVIVFRDNQWKPLSDSDVLYLLSRQRGGEFFRYAGYIYEGEEGVFPDNIDTTELIPGNTLEWGFSAYYDLTPIGSRRYDLDDLLNPSYFTVESNDRIYYDNLRGRARWLKNLASFWDVYRINVAEGTKTPLDGGREQIEFDITGVFPRIDEAVDEFQNINYTFSPPSVMWESEYFPNYYDRHSWTLTSNPNIYNREIAISNHQWKINPITQA